jgi:energy-coupling factor transporter ATP-binding protein EcfA2
MELASVTVALMELMKILKKYIHFKDQSSYLVLALFILLTHCFKNFDTVPYLLITGPYGSGKSLTLELLTILLRELGTPTQYA